MKVPDQALPVVSYESFLMNQLNKACSIGPQEFRHHLVLADAVDQTKDWFVYKFNLDKIRSNSSRLMKIL